MFISGARQRAISQQGTGAFLKGRPSFRDRVADYLKARPNTWVDGMVIAQIGGCYASRTRISNCRRQLGMTIENRQRTVSDHAAGCPAVQAWDIEGACQCGRSARRVISEYRYVPPQGQQELFEAGR